MGESARVITTRRVRTMLLPVLCVLSFAVQPSAYASNDSGAQEETVAASSQSQGSGGSLGEQVCGVEVEPTPPIPRQVNLVLDDSGSMFADANGPVDRWSNAKYSLEVFAAMLGPEDLLNVYRTSDFVDGKTSGPAAQVSGEEPIEKRIQAIHRLDMIGGGTPYAPVPAAVADLSASSFAQKWLVVVSDGAFEGVETAQVQSDMERFAAENTTEDTTMNVAFLALGDAAPALTNNPDAGVFFQQAQQTDDLLAVMTGFSNRIFARSQIEGTLANNSWGIDPDTELEELLVFAQGEDVEVGALSSGSTVLEPTSVGSVSWVENSASELKAVPNKSLTGKLATFENVPPGGATVSISGAQVVDFFYKPRVSFGIVLKDASGSVVAADKIVGGDYSVSFGFMDRDCNFVDSPLLGDVQYSAVAMQDGEVIADQISPGDTITLERGDAQFRVSANYLNNNVTEAVVDVRVLRPAQPTLFEVEPREFEASQLDDYVFPADAMKVRYGIDEGGTLRNFSEEEWASFDKDSFTVSTTEKLEFEVEVGDEPGLVYLLPRAPGGVPIDASTGEVPVHIAAHHIYDEQLNEAELDTEITINDDFSVWQRMLHWFMTVGWKWLLLLLGLVIIYGYIRRPRLPKKLRKSPLVEFRPKNPTMRRTQADGKVTKSALPKFVPFMADSAQIRYVPSGTGGFSALKVKAMKGGRMRVVNWKALAQKGNVEFDGDLLTKESKKARTLGGSSVITATAADGSYECSLGTSKRGKKA